MSSPGNSYEVSSSRGESSTSSSSSGSSTASHLLSADDDVGNAHLASEQHVLARLRHGAVGGRYRQDSSAVETSAAPVIVMFLM